MNKNILTTLIVFILFSLEIQSQDKLPHYTVGIMYNLFSDVNINDASAVCDIWINEIAKPRENDFTLGVKIFNSLDEAVTNFKNGNLAILSLGINEFFLYKDQLGLEPVLVPSLNGETNFEHLLLVRKADNFKKLNDLKGKNISISSSYDPASARIWFEIISARNDIKNKEKFFNNILEVPKESQLVLDLFFGKIDACIVREKPFKLMNELNPQIGERLTALVSSPDYLISVICFTKNLTNESHKKYFMESALQIHKDVSGKQLMTLLKIDMLIPFKDDYLNTYKELVKEYKNRFAKK